MSRLQDELTATLKIGLGLFADAMIATQNHKDGKSHSAAGYGARSGSDLLDFAPQLLKTAKLIKDEVGFKLSWIDLNGNWDFTGNSSGYLANIFHVPSTGYISLKVPNSQGGVNTYFGAEYNKVFLLTGLNTAGDYLIVRLEPKGADGIAANCYSKAYGAESFTYYRP